MSTDAYRARHIVYHQYDAEADEVQLLFVGPDEHQFGLLLPRSIGPLVCAAITTAAATAPPERKMGEQEFQALRYDALELAMGPDGKPVICFVAADGSRLNMSTTAATPQDLRRLATHLEAIATPPPEKTS